MSTARENKHREAEALTFAIENLLRKIVRFLIGRMTLAKLQEIIRFVFIEEIENSLIKENPSKNVSLTQLALLSGLDTRTLTKIRNSEEFRSPTNRANRLLRELTPVASVLDDWMSKPPYLSPKTGKPRPLNISGPSPSFESLFCDSVRGRGVTYQALLDGLVESKSVDVDPKTRKVTLKSEAYLPSHSEDMISSIELGFSAIGNLTETVSRNINSIGSEKDRFYQRGTWTYRLRTKNRHKLRNRLKELFETTDIKAREIISQFEEPSANSDQITAGASMFYFEERNS